MTQALSAVYVLDSNVFIQAFQRYYPMDFHPGFWDFIEQEHLNGTLHSIDRVKQELERRNDRLAEWARRQPPSMFISTDGFDVQTAFGAMSRWVANGNFRRAAVREFADIADGFLVAYAQTRGSTVVTLEVSSPDAKKKIPIPNLCDAFSVPFDDSFAMLRNLGANFNLSP